MRRRFTGALGARLSALTTALLFGGCAAVGPDFQRPEVPWLAGWSSSSLASLMTKERGTPKAQIEEWWRNFKDPELDRLVAEAQRVNRDVRTAGMRILESRAQLMIAGSLLYPQQQQVTGSVLRTGEVRSSGGNVALTNGPFGIGEDLSEGRHIAFTAYNAGLGFGWEIDFWGKFRRSIEAADAGYFASIAQYDDLQVLMAAQVADSYCAIRTIELRLKIARENAALQKRSLEITEELFKHGNESELDVQQAKAQYLGTLSTIPQLEGSLRQTQNALGVLLARPPGPLPELAQGKDTIPQAELGVIVDLPADLLRRRPDVRAVEMQLAAQSAQIGVKEADFYPSITLLGSLGLSATSLAGSPRTLAYGIGPSLVWNVFDHGRLTGEVLVQDARFQQLYEQYQAAVLKAAREVDDAAVGFATNRAQIPILKDAVNAARRSLAIANIQYQEGMSDFQRVLDTQRTLFSQQELLVSTLSNVTLSLIALYKAMGGGWQQGRGRPLVDDATRASMGERSDWREILAAPLPPPDAGPQLITPTRLKP
jgi:NodT family efflux transporter outer membrane factor (OMF) lipoprotein